MLLVDSLREMEHPAQSTPRGRKAGRVLCFVLTVFLGLGSAGAESLRGDKPQGTPGHDTLSRRVESVLETPGFQAGHWGILVVDRKSGQTIYERDADQLFAPASVTKLFTTAAALVGLGPNHRFQTPLVRRGEIDPKGTLRGDLILIAQGDLAMGGRTGPEGTLVLKDDDHTYADGNLNSQVVPLDPLAGLDDIAREAHAAGIRQVAGDVIVDDRLFAPAESTGSGPRVLSPIVINDNVIDVLAQPAPKAGEPAQITFQPATQFVTMDAHVATVEAGQPAALAVHPVGPWRFAVRGQLPVGHSRVVKLYQVDEPASFARALLIEALRRRGVLVASSILDLNSTAGLTSPIETAKLPRVALYTSPPFSEYIRVTLKVSHNLYASTLPLLLAVRHGRAHALRGPEVARESPAKPGHRPRPDLFWRRSRGDRARSGQSARDGGPVARDGGSTRVCRLRRGIADPGTRRHAGQGGRYRQPRAGARPRQDRNLLRHQRSRWQSRLDEQGAGGLPRDGLGPFPDLRRFRQQCPAQRPPARSFHLRRDRRGRPATG